MTAFELILCLLGCAPPLIFPEPRPSPTPRHPNAPRLCRYGEIEIAEAFDKQWYGINFCRVTINYSPRNWVPAGGNPSDNNGTEATNRAHKYFINHVHVTGENYISDIAT